MDAPQSQGANPWLWTTFTNNITKRITAMRINQSASDVAAMVGIQMGIAVQNYTCTTNSPLTEPACGVLNKIKKIFEFKK